MHLNLGTVDLSILIFLVSVSVFLGLWFGREAKSSETYLLGNRDLPWWAILGSIVATESSIATVLSVPGIGFGESGFRFFQLAIGVFLGRLLVVNFLLPSFFSGKISSAYEILKHRFGGRVQGFASGLFLITRNLGDGLRLYLTAIVLQQLLGWDFIWCALAVSLTTIFYTLFGGMKSIVWNDCIQLVIYLLAGLIVIFVLIYLIPGGWSQYWQYASSNGKLQVFQFFPPEGESFFYWIVGQRDTFWAGLVGGCFLSVGTHGTDQMMIQRYLSARSQKEAGRALALSGFFVMFQFALFLFIGTLLACFYADPDINTPEKTDKIFSHFMIHYVPVGYGLTGLFLAAIFSASMSTLSSSLGSSSTAAWVDFISPRIQSSNEKLSDKSELIWNRSLVVFFGILQLGIGILATRLDKSVVDSALAIAGFAAGILLGIFVLGLFFRKISAQAVFIGTLAGTFILLFLKFGLPVVFVESNGEPSITVAWPWFALIGSGSTVLVAQFTQLFLRPDQE